MKKSYKIPHSINVSRLDIPFTLFNRRFLISDIFKFIFLGFFGPLILLQFTFLKNGHLPSKIIVITGWEILTWQFIIPKANGQRGLNWMIATLNYWVTVTDRKVKTRGNEPVADISKLLNIDPEVPVKDGIIPFLDGFVGYVYQFDGYASNMLFESDQEKVIDAFENFMANLSVAASLSNIQLYAPLDISDQISHADIRVSKQTHPSLARLAEYRRDLLKHDVTKFPVVTQFVVLIAPSIVTLNEQALWLERQVKAGMAKQAKRLNSEDAIRALGMIYRP